MRKKAKKVMGFTALGVTTSVGASVVTSAGGSATGLGNIASQYPAMGTIMGSGMVLDELGKMVPKEKRKRR